MISLLALLMLGCAEYTLADRIDDAPVDPIVDAQSLALVVTPSVDLVAEDGTARKLPVFLQDPVFDEPITVDLPRPFALLGTVRASAPTPGYRASIPGSDGPTHATLHLRTAGLPGVSRAVTGEAGEFGIAAVEASYSVTVTPDDPELPITSFMSDLAAGQSLDVVLEGGVPLWGRVTDGGEPMPGALVHARTIDGIAGPTAVTDEDGWYHLRVAPGDYSVSTSGSGDGFDPVLTEGPGAVGVNGRRQDFAYVGASLHDVTARVVGPNGGGIGALDFRMRALELFDYPEGAAAEITGTADSRGNIVTQVAAGVWVLDLLPDREHALTALRVDEITIDEDLELGVLPLAALTRFRGTVVDAAGLVVPDALIACREVGFRGRTWSGFADVNGRFAFDVGSRPASCDVTPPEVRTDLALTRASVDPAASNVRLVLLRGAPLFGEVRFDDRPEPFALVEVQDAAGLVWGSALTDERGEFSLRVNHPQ